MNRMYSADYLNRLLLKYSGTFDIYQPYTILGREYPAYGYFFSHMEKYVLVRKANMWSADSYEHILFATPDELTSAHLLEYRQAITEYIEPTLILKGKKLPEPNHMYSYITVAVVTEKALSPEMKRAVKKFKFEKSYMHSVRGYSQARLAVASMEDESVCLNGAGRKLKKLYKSVFAEVKAGKSGYREALKEQGIESFQQKHL